MACVSDSTDFGAIYLLGLVLFLCCLLPCALCVSLWVCPPSTGRGCQCQGQTGDVHERNDEQPLFGTPFWETGAGGPLFSVTHQTQLHSGAILAKLDGRKRIIIWPKLLECPLHPMDRILRWCSLFFSWLTKAGSAYQDDPSRQAVVIEPILFWRVWLGLSYSRNL